MSVTDGVNGNGRSARWASRQSRMDSTDPRGAAGLAAMCSQAASLTCSRDRPGGAAQALLRRGHHQVGLPRGEVAADAAEGGDRVDDEQRAVLGHHGRDRVEIVDGAAWRLAVHHADHGDIGPGAEGLGDAHRGHGTVVGNLDLDDLPGVPAGPVAVAAAVHPGHQVEHHVPGPDQRGGRRLQPDHGLALQDDRALPGPERLPQQLHRPLVQRAEGRVQVMQDRPAERGQGGRSRAGRPAGQVERRITGSRIGGLLHVGTSNSYQISRNLSGRLRILIIAGVQALDRPGQHPHRRLSLRRGSRG